MKKANKVNGSMATFWLSQEFHIVKSKRITTKYHALEKKDFSYMVYANLQGGKKWDSLKPPEIVGLLLSAMLCRPCCVVSFLSISKKDEKKSKNHVLFFQDGLCPAWGRRKMGLTQAPEILGLLLSAMLCPPWCVVSFLFIPKKDEKNSQKKKCCFFKMVYAQLGGRENWDSLRPLKQQAFCCLQCYVHPRSTQTQMEMKA